MSTTEELARDPFIMPSPYMEGAFACQMCGNAHLVVALAVSEENYIVEIVCPSCKNRLAFKLGVSDDDNDK